MDGCICLNYSCPLWALGALPGSALSTRPPAFISRLGCWLSRHRDLIAFLLWNFEYLGILFTSDGCMRKAVGRMQLPFSLAMARVCSLIKREGIVDTAFAYVWLFQVKALSASLYGCQAWSIPFLQPAKAEQTVLSRSHALFFKRILGLPVTASTRCVLRECGQLPLQFYWVRCVSQFWNACLGNSNQLVQARIRADCRLAGQCGVGWVADVLRYLEEPGGRHAWRHSCASNVRLIQPVNITQFSKQWVLADLADWRVYDGHEPAGIMREDLNRVQCAYHTYFAVPPHDVCSWRVPSVRRTTDKPILPRYFTVPLRPDL